ncbi:hypothetical protein [Akkermansia sp.]|uniref:hypothetical protein n=1 Tax=Akkermansia sp. TaxID=1872421 RepID=UPI003A63C0E6
MVRTFPGTASCFSSGKIAGNKMLDIFIIHLLSEYCPFFIVAVSLADCKFCSFMANKAGIRASAERPFRFPTEITYK